MGIGSQLAYAAGIWDGDGCVFCSERENVSGQNSYVVRMSINLDSKKVIEKLNGLLAGNMGKFSGRKDGWYFASSSIKAAESLKRIIPFLLAKKPQAEIAINLQREMTESRNKFRTIGKEGASPVPEVIMKNRKMMVDKIYQLKEFNSAGFELDEAGISKEELLSYCAGLVDSDGCISIVSSGKMHTPLVQIKMGDLLPMLRFSSIFGGSFYDDGNMNTLRLKGSKSVECLRVLLPYLIIKREQADLAILFQNSIDLWKKRFSSGYPKVLPQEVKEKRRELIARVRDLNQAKNNRYRAGAETKLSQSEEIPISDSPIYGDDKPIANESSVRL